MKEAAVRHAPLTVLTVHQTSAGYYGAEVNYPGDVSLAQRAQAAAQEETDKVLAGLGEPQPASVTVRAAAGIAAEELVNASRDTDMIVLGSRGTGGFAHLRMGSVSSQVSHHAYCPVVIIPA